MYYYVLIIISYFYLVCHHFYLNIYSNLLNYLWSNYCFRKAFNMSMICETNDFMPYITLVRETQYSAQEVSKLIY